MNSKTKQRKGRPTIAQLEASLRVARSEKEFVQATIEGLRKQRDDAASQVRSAARTREALIEAALVERDDLQSRLRRLDMRLICLRGIPGTGRMDDCQTLSQSIG